MITGDRHPRSLILQTIAWQTGGLVLLIFHVVLVKLSLIFFPIVVGLIGWLFARASLAGLVVFIQTLLYQNIIISIFSTDMDYQTFNILQGTNFVVLAVLGLISVLRLAPFIDRHRLIAFCLLTAMVALILYTALGAIKAGPTSAMVYFREFASPLLGGIVGIEIGRVWPFRSVGLSFMYSSMLAIGLGGFEYLYPVDFYSIINEVQFLQLKYHSQLAQNLFYTPQDIVNHFTSVFFNITAMAPSIYSFHSFRFGGTIINPISNAYVLSVTAIIAVALKRGLWLIVLVPMLIMVGVKGANVLLLSSLVLYLTQIICNSRFALVFIGICFAVFYVASGIIIGLGNNDFHVLGLIGGMNSLIHDPIGHGIGVGGNLSTNANAGFKWTGTGGFVHGGVDFALESAIGVLVYQMGFASITILGVFLVFLWKSPLGQAAPPRRSDIVFLALAMIVVNGVFQEEAFAPYAAGLIMLLAGVLIGNDQPIDSIVHLPSGRHNRLGIVSP
jgi:hypothetical protein